MTKYANKKRGTLHNGTELARLYIMDMIDEHYQSFGTTKEIKDFLKERPDYVNLLHSDIGWYEVKDKYKEMTRNLTLYICKQRCKGVLLYYKNLLMKINKIRQIAYDHKFTDSMQ